MFSHRLVDLLTFPNPAQLIDCEAEKTVGVGVNTLYIASYKHIGHFWSNSEMAFFIAFCIQVLWEPDAGFRSFVLHHGRSASYSLTQSESGLPPQFNERPKQPNN